MQVIEDSEWLAVSYILAAVLFIMALKGLGTEETAMSGCWMGIMGMLVTVVAAMASDYVMEEAYWLIPLMIVPFAALGVWYAYSVITDRLPELVGLFNSFGGLAAALEGVAVYTDRTAVFSMYTGELLTPTEQKIQLVVLWFSIVIGMMTFTGSVVAVLKLTSGWIKHPHKHSKVTLSPDGKATFKKPHGVRKGRTDKKTGRNVDSDVLNKLDAKGRKNRYALNLTFAASDGRDDVTLTAYDVIDAKTLQMTSNKKADEAVFEGGQERSGSGFTCTWEHETENLWHIDSKPVQFLGGKAPQALLGVLMIACCAVTFVIDDSGVPLYTEGRDYWLGVGCILALAASAGLVGVLQAMAVSGADMAVVICVLNSGSGWSGVAAGFMINNELLLVTGAFVGASGAILSYLMCQAMNVPLLRVLGMMAPPPEPKPSSESDGVALPEPQLETAPQVAERLREAKSVVIAPGYGMAAGKAQGVVGKLAETLRAQGKEVRFCIHPVAGRLPGHMNILLAEAQVPYDWVCAMDEINPDFKNTDVALCVGAWDTVNPAAAEDPDCPVYGMPMCRVWDAKVCVVNKRSLGSASGFSGAQNLLPHKDNTRMLLGTAAEQVQALLDIVGKDARVGEDGEGAEGEGNEEGNEAVSAEAVGPSLEELEAMRTFRTLCVPKETSDPSGKPLADPSSELRCALSPKAALHLRRALGFRVKAEAGLGLRSLFTDDMYRAAGVEVVETVDAEAHLYRAADVLLKVNPPVPRRDLGGHHELSMLPPGATYVSFLPVMHPGDTPDKCGPEFKDIVLRAVDRKINLLSMGHLPRISRAQKSDAISTFGKLAGHRACIEAAAHYGRIMPGEITSAGKNPQAKAWVGGCGVAGLEAVAILKKMGCEVYATDVRDIEDQIVSVGGKFVHYDPEGLKRAKDSGGYAPVFGQEMQDQQDAMYSRWSRECDIMVLTAAIPGMPPPRLLSKAMVDAMRPGSVVVDIAANDRWAALYREAEKKGSVSYEGRSATPWPGNCEYTVPGELFVAPNGVRVVGYTDMPSRFGSQATEFYANNLVSLLEDMCAKGTVAERGVKEPELGTAEDFKIDMHVVRAQSPEDGHESYAKGEFAIGDDIMTGMCLVKVEGGDSSSSSSSSLRAMLDCPKKRKPMETAQAIFEKGVRGRGLGVPEMEAELPKLEAKSSEASAALLEKYGVESATPEGLHAAVTAADDPRAKVEAALAFADAKQRADEVKWMAGVIKKEKQEIAKADKERRLAELQAKKGGGGGPWTSVALGALGLGALAAMAFIPFPASFISNVMIFVLASVLGYCLVAGVKPSLHTPLMSMSNAISGIVIIGGMYQIQGLWLWGGAGWPDGTAAAGGGVSATLVLGAVAVAISAINIGGGFAVTFRMLAMFSSSDADANKGGRKKGWLSGIMGRSSSNSNKDATANKNAAAANNKPGPAEASIVSCEAEVLNGVKKAGQQPQNEV